MHRKKIHLLCLSLAFASACVVEGTDDDDTAVETDGNGSNGEGSNGEGSNGEDGSGGDSDGEDSNGEDSNGEDSNGEDSNGEDSNGDDTNASDTATSDTAGDESSGDDGPIGDAIPQEGSWLYTETGGTTNDCTFVADPSNGWGTYLVENVSASGFAIVPADGTGTFDCELDSGDFHCPERLVDTLGEPGLDIVANVFVVVDGQILSETEMAGSQIGHIECEGTQCAEAEIYLGVSFPCAFEIPFTGDKT